MIYLTHSNEQNIIDAQAQICLNCGFPNAWGTNNWCDIEYNSDLGVFYIVKPPVWGWSNGHATFTQEQMMSGVIDVIEQEWES